MIKIVKFCFLFMFISGLVRAESVPSLGLQENPELVNFATHEVLSAAASLKLSQKPNLNFRIDTNMVQQSYKIEETSKFKYPIIGGDETGLMDGGLELAEQIKIAKAIPDLKAPIVDKPFIKERGLKFNIPLDIRTPSYQDADDAAQNNILEMWQQKDMGSFANKFSVKIAAHGGRLYRISPINMYF